MAEKYRLKSLGQEGMVSIIVTMVLIIVMTLVVLAMSRNSIIEQRQALDRQLSDQAFYNAESGINDWANYLYNNPTLQIEKTTCDSSGFTGAPNNQIGTDPTNTYPCILYDKAPTSIVYSNVSPEEGKVVTINPNINLRTLTFSWKGSTQNILTAGCNSNTGSLLPTGLPANCNVGGVKLDLIDPSTANRDALINNNFTAYLLPNGSVAPSTINLSSGRGAAGQGMIGIARCTTAAGCSISINMDSFGAGGLPANSTLYMHFRALYSSIDPTITGVDASGNSVRFNNSQTLLDATGKANDVLRRVQVRIGARSQYEQTDFSLRTVDSICKLITVDRDAAIASIDSQCL